MPRTGLPARRQAFCELYVYKANGNATEAARLAGYKHADPEGRQLLRFPTVAAEVARLQEEKRAGIKAEGIANLQNRIDLYSRVVNGITTTLDERGVDPTLMRAPGGKTGLVVRKYKTIANPDPTKPPLTVTEDQLDTAAITSLLNTLKQAATELGQWAERKEHTGKDGGPLELAFTFGIQSANRVGQLTDGDDDPTG